MDPDVAMATVVWEFEEQAGDQQRAAIQHQLASLQDMERVRAGEISGPMPSDDGQAVQAQVPIDVSGDTEALGQGVEQLRETLEAPGGSVVYVTGMAGTLADLSNAFAGIDGILLIVALVVVLAILILVY